MNKINILDIDDVQFTDEEKQILKKKKKAFRQKKEKNIYKRMLKNYLNEDLDHGPKSPVKLKST